METTRKAILKSFNETKRGFWITPATVTHGARSLDDRRSGIQLALELHGPADSLVPDRSGA